MIDSDILAVAESRIAQDLEDRRNAFEHEVGTIWGEMSLNGVLHSSMTIQRTQDAIGNEFRVRCSLIWHAFARAFDAKRLTLNESIVTELKQHVAHKLQRFSDDLSKHYDRAAQLMPSSPIGKSLDSLRDAAFERICTEIDYVLLKHTASSVPGPDAINIYQGFGIVQTGTGASASFTVNLGSEERREIETALKAVEQALKQAASLGSSERDQALELVTDVNKELSRNEPNGFRIRGALQGLATTIQTVAAAPQAYQLLKGAAALLGLHLP